MLDILVPLSEKPPAGRFFEKKLRKKHLQYSVKMSFLGAKITIGYHMTPRIAADTLIHASHQTRNLFVWVLKTQPPEGFKKTLKTTALALPGAKLFDKSLTKHIFQSWAVVKLLRDNVKCRLFLTSLFFANLSSLSLMGPPVFHIKFGKLDTWPLSVEYMFYEMAIGIFHTMSPRTKKEWIFCISNMF